jgi:hypothetical protein
MLNEQRLEPRQRVNIMEGAASRRCSNDICPAPTELRFCWRASVAET